MAPILQLDSISKRFGAVVVADGLDLSVPQGEALGVIGPNGAGKTSLFGMITGTLAQDSGRVLFRGADLAGHSPAARCAKGIARSFQVPQPFGGMSVFENLLVAAEFGLADRTGNLGADCARILERCGLTEEECHALVDLVRDVKDTGVTIVWIEHIVHALVAVVDRLVVLHGGAFIADGEPREVIRRPQVMEIYMGIPANG